MRAVLLVLLVVLGPGAARAQPAPRAAVEHFQRGKTLQEAGKWADALVEYRAAQAIAPRPALLFNMAQCLRKLGQMREALDLYQEFVDSNPEGAKIDEARGYIALIKQQLTPAPAEPKPVAPPPPVVAAPPPPVLVVASLPPPGSPRHGLRIAAFVAGGVGVAVLGAGVAFGLRARAASQSLDDHWSRAAYDAGRAAERNMLIGYGVGAAALGAGVVLYVVSGRRLRAEPVVGPEGGGLSVSGRF